MLTYNTQRKKLVLPEYGRNIQRMVDHCLTIEDRDERTRCAYTIIASMGNLFPELRESEENRHKLWDHLAIMSGFKLDIDYPCEVVREEDLQSFPEKMLLPQSDIRRRQYGKYIDQMIAKASEMEEGPDRDQLVLLIANHMKKTLAMTNPESADDARVFNDLAELSHGAIRLRTDSTRLHEFQIVQPATGKKKKKK